ncbi:DUF1566 domain-containing protein [Pseudomonas sp. SZMC_28357]|uniref:DUF1566 domain-containing protein n=1 Tax=Pseudomonas sp. SZMC_28357 TaxID=3074380 RepID=UPI002871D6FC|nr:DUF1566 domain-containing protein [Pseudomonas sp. SZMC_28357]MDR9749877.1 DUF1566 domain-containing protein [Pseudomonas sp. SZMC_28357]
MNTAEKFQVPALGEVWPGEGGIYAGVMPARGDAPAYRMILGAELGRFEWGPYAEEAPVTGLIDGFTNTLVLIESDDEYPAAKAAYEHEADGHNDFYLPAVAELYEIWLNLNGKNDGWVWSSSQRSANYAFHMHFGDGTQSYGVKDGELRVRPVRRLPI